jgi:hypothetical protein
VPARYAMSRLQLSFAIGAILRFLSHFDSRQHPFGSRFEDKIGVGFHILPKSDIWLQKCLLPFNPELEPCIDYDFFLFGSHFVFFWLPWHHIWLPWHHKFGHQLSENNVILRYLHTKHYHLRGCLASNQRQEKNMSKIGKTQMLFTKELSIDPLSTDITIHR